MRSRKTSLFLLLVFGTAVLWAQGAYYDGIDTSKSTFVTDLHNLVYPHTRISYDQFDETNVANFASRDTTGGQRAVNCVYTGFIYVYTLPYTWAVFSREHTWCQSWMPSRDATNYTSLPEYSDQHHIFPVHQNYANVRRSNHPLGKVRTITYQYLEGRLGTDSLGKAVYEPRDAHKGDAARALLYMAICYNGVNGYDWTFHYLNTVTLLDSLHEAPQDVSLLIQWSKEDPPDDWEKARNEYVYSIQRNRNPFIDHPEYADIIDFSTLTKKMPDTTTSEVEVIVGDAPRVFTLLQNYPNPFNPTTIIPFTLPEDGRATISVYDILGREVATLVDTEMKAGFEHQVVLDGSKLSSGIYLVRLQLANMNAVRKILLMK